jgi:hypothetical protein
VKLVVRTSQIPNLPPPLTLLPLKLLQKFKHKG